MLIKTKKSLPYKKIVTANGFEISSSGFEFFYIFFENLFISIDFTRHAIRL